MAEAKKVVAVLGGYRVAAGSEEYKVAEELGRRIAEAGWTLLNGGYSGTMEASARGARNRVGDVIGVPVEIYSARVNSFVTETVLTKDLWERLRVILDRSDAFLALPGATGTLAEIAMAWEFMAKKLMRPKPLVFIGNFWAPLVQVLAPVPWNDAGCGGLVRTVGTPKEAIGFLIAHWSGIPRPDDA